jgi:hypothetical protein
LKYFVYKLISPRPTFPIDITEVEEKLMQEHGAYWKDLAERRIAVIFGPVFDPKGAYGMAIVEVKEEAFVHEIALKDPAIKAAVGFRFEVYPMHEPVLRK